MSGICGRPMKADIFFVIPDAEWRWEIGVKYFFRAPAAHNTFPGGKQNSEVGPPVAGHFFFTAPAAHVSLASIKTDFFFVIPDAKWRW